MVNDIRTRTHFRWMVRIPTRTAFPTTVGVHGVSNDRRRARRFQRPSTRTAFPTTVGVHGVSNDRRRARRFQRPSACTAFPTIVGVHGVSNDRRRARRFQRSSACIWAGGADKSAPYDTLTARVYAPRRCNRIDGQWIPAFAGMTAVQCSVSPRSSIATKSASRFARVSSFLAV